MKLLTVVVVMVVASASGEGTAAPAEWAVDPPPGWLEEVIPQALRDRVQAAPGIAQAELRVWKPGDGGAARLQAQWFVLRRGEDSEQKLIDQFDLGLVRSIAKKDKQTDQPPRSVGSMLIRDTTIDKPHMRVRAVRRYQPAADGVHVLFLGCSGEAIPATCDAAINGGRLSVENPTTLPAGGSQHSVAYDAGYVAGIVALLGLGAWLVFRKRG